MNPEQENTLQLDDARHQRLLKREWILERCGMILVVLILLAALLGVLGPGLLSYRVVRSLDGKLTVEYYAIQRNEAPAELIVRFKGSVPDKRIRVGVSRSFTERTIIERVTPQPESSDLEDDRLVYTFRAANLNGEGTIIFHYKHVVFGSVTYAIDLMDDSRLQAHQFVLP